MRCVLVILSLVLAAPGLCQKTSSGISIPPELMQEYIKASREGNQKKIKEILARIPWQDPLAERLFSAVSKGNVARVADLLRKGANPNANRSNGWRPLISLGGSSKQAFLIAQLLIAKGANVNYRQPDQGWTPLISAVSTEPTSLELLKLLLSKHADINAKMSTGETALHMAVRFGRRDAVRYLVQQGANLEARTQPEPTPNLSSPFKEDDKFFAEERARQENENAERMAAYFEPGYRESGKTPLFEAVRVGDMTMIETLISYGAKIDAVDDNGWTLLHEAVRMGKLDVLPFLLKKGLDVNRSSKAGYTPLHEAVRVGFMAVAMLLDFRADPKIKDKAGYTPLDLLLKDEARTLKLLASAPHAEKDLERYRSQVSRVKELLSKGKA